MRIISTNIAKPVIIKWRGKNVTTGIFKKPTKEPIFLGKKDVKGDEVTDRKYHGGIYKASYLFSAEQYPYWKDLYPNLDWTYGMFGENLTVSGLDETKLYIGDIYKIGKALIQISQPREPCYKFGVKFGTQKVLKQFIQHGHSGTYVSVLEEGNVEVGNELELVERYQNSLTTSNFFELLFTKEKDQQLLKLAILNEALPEKKREQLKSFLKDN
ncbi:MAG: MOSC domain-containing protein [Aquaticitalea sp.]